MEGSKLDYCSAVAVFVLVLLSPGFLVVAIVFSVYTVQSVNLARIRHHQYLNMHLAIACDGIYVDECDDRTQTIMKRSIIRYEDVHDIQTTPDAAYLNHNGYTYYDVHIKDAEGKVTHLLHGFFNVQKFVDILKAMMVESRRSHAPKPDDNNGGNVHTTDHYHNFYKANDVDDNDMEEREPLIIDRKSK